MKQNNLAGFVTVLILGVSTMAFAHDAQKFTGVVSDPMCGAEHMTKEKSAADCTRECAKQGDYALVVGAKVYTLKGDKEAIGKLAGATAVVEGDLDGKTIKVESIEAAK